MRHDLSFPCMEQPTRCFITTNNGSSSNSSRSNNSNDRALALSCDRSGRVFLSPRRSAAGEWYLLTSSSTSCSTRTCKDHSSPTAGGGIVRLINKAYGLELQNFDDDFLRATTCTTTSHNPQDDNDSQDACNDEGTMELESANQHNSSDYLHLMPEERDLTEHDDPNLWLLELDLSPQQPTTTSASNENDNKNQDATNTIPTMQRRVRIRSMDTNSYLSSMQDHNNENTTTTPRVACHAIHTNNNNNNSIHPFWSIELLTGELCHLQLASSYAIPNAPPKLLMCDNFGRLRITPTWGGWEVFRITPVVGHHDTVVTLGSWTHRHRYVACQADGTVVTTHHPSDASAMWTLSRVPQGISIRNSQHGRYLSYHTNQQQLVALSAYPGAASAAWRCSAAHQQCYYLSTTNHNNHQRSSSSWQLSTLRGGRQVTTISYRLEWKVWQLHQIDHGDNIVVLQSKRWKTYLAVSSNGQEVQAASSLLLDDDSTRHPYSTNGYSAASNMDQACLWRMVPSNGGGVYLQSVVEPGCFAACQTGGGPLSLVQDAPSATVWQLEPVLPFSLQSWHIGLVVGGAAVGAAALLAPAMVLGSVAATEAGGAAAAAATVAAAEVAAVEVAAVETAAGFGVGLGLAGAGAAAAGAAVGASVTGLVVRNHQSPDGMVLSSAPTTVSSSLSLFPGHHRPFCEWEFHNFGRRHDDDDGIVEDCMDLRLEL